VFYKTPKQDDSRTIIAVDSGIIKKRHLIKDIRIINPLEFISLEDENEK